MKFRFLIIIVVFVSINLYTLGFRDLSDVINFHNILATKNIFVPKKISFKTSFSYLNSKALNDNLYFDNETNLVFANYFLVSNKFRFDKMGLKAFQVDISFSPFDFMTIILGYSARPFSQYKTFEHNIILDTKLFYDKFKYLTFGIDSGLLFRFQDLDVYNNNKVYDNNLLFYAIFFYKIYILANPVKFYSVGLSIGNRNNFEIYSFNDIAINSKIIFVFLKIFCYL